MKKFNLIKEIISIEKPPFMAAINSAKPFGITIEGEIVTPPYENDKRYIFQGSVSRPAPSPMMPAKQPGLAELLGGKMQVVEVEDRILIKAAGNWQEIIRYNLPNADYDDTTGDGVDEFTDSELETIGWHAAEFGITYRELVDIIEDHCDGLLLCIEREGENYQFSGMGFIDDMPCARTRCFDHCVRRITETLEKDASYTEANLTGDEKEALAFFGVTLPDSAAG